MQLDIFEIKWNAKKKIDFYIEKAIELLVIFYLYGNEQFALDKELYSMLRHTQLIFNLKGGYKPNLKYMNIFYSKLDDLKRDKSKNDNNWNNYIDLYEAIKIDWVKIWNDQFRFVKCKRK